jgi:hypothetical protein
MPSKFRRLLHKNYASILTKILPRSRAGDYIFAIAIFLKSHKRWPGRNPLFSDYLFRMRVGGELEDALRQFVSDKEFSKIYVKAKVGEGYTVPTFGVLKTEHEISSFNFPERCVIKPTHGAGQVILRIGGEPLKLEKIGEMLKTNLYRKGREINYKNLKPKIIVEDFALSLDRAMEIKFFCFCGQPKFAMLSQKNGRGRRQTFLDLEWRPLPFRISLPPDPEPVGKPKCLDEMIDVARKLSEPFEFLRLDFYCDGVNFVIGELTNCHASGAARFASRADEEAFSKALFA